jgi:hypothetical protein
MVRGQPGQIVCKTLSGKYSTQKRAGGVVQVVEQLPSKSKALNSNPSTTTTTKKKKDISKIEYGALKL